MRLIGKNVILETETMTFYDEKIWFSEFQSGDFYYYDLRTQKTVLFCENPEKNFQRRAYGAIIKHKEYFYLIPLFAKKMYKIGLLGGCIEVINFDYNTDLIFESGHFFSALSAHLYNEKIYIIPAQVACIIEYDCNTGKIYCFENWEKKEFIKFEDEKLVCRKTSLINNKIYIPYCKGNKVAVFDLRTKKIVVNTVGSEKCSYSAICLSGDFFWLAPRNGYKAVSWNEKTNFTRECDLVEKKKLKKNTYGEILALEKKVLVMPINEKVILSIDCFGGRVSELNCGNTDMGGVSYCKNKDMIYIFSMQSGKLYIYNTACGVIEEKYMIAPLDIENAFRKESSKVYRILHNYCDTNINILHEDYNEALNSFCDYIKKLDDNKSYEERNDKNGKNIWTYSIDTYRST